MKRIATVIILAATLLVACGPSREERIDQIEDFEDLPICYFLKGIAYESDSQFEKARQAYQTFVDKYPDHYMADQTRKMIPLVGKSTEEMLDDILAAANDTIIAR